MKTKFMKTTNFIILLAISVAVSFTSCSKKEGCTDPTAENYDPNAEKDNGTCLYKTPTTPVPTKTSGKLTFTFAHHFDGTTVTHHDVHAPAFSFINEFGDTLSITKLKYLVSDIRLFKSNGDSILIDGYRLVDLSDENTQTWATTVDIPFDSYTNIKFTFGFDSTDNVSNAYADLNSASWNWPAGIGGGYHFMMMEGKYKYQGNDSTYAYHMGTAHNMMTMTNEQNFFVADLGPIAITNDASVQIKMDISEWYKNPYTWSLNAYHSGLMMNYTAQKNMNLNGPTVFSLGVVVQ